MLEDRLQAGQIISRWRQTHRIDIRSELERISEVELYRCSQCRLAFFKPEAAAGSSALYEALEKEEGYYLPNKWEHDAALQDIDGSRDGLEIGCGFGAFVARVIAERGIAFEGCEQNPSAVRTAQSRGIPVHLTRLEDLVKQRAACFDAICAFQVLEHVTNPGEFLMNSCSLLRPGGKLILGVPNNRSVITRFVHFFDAPPHHMSRWDRRVLSRLPKLFPLEEIRIACEPLPETKVEMYVEAVEERLRGWRLRWLVHPWLRSRMIRLLRATEIRRFLKGDTIYGCFVRTRAAAGEATI